MIPKNYQAAKPCDIGSVIDFALEYNPNLAFSDLQTIHMWLNEGCDIELDILPIMREITERRSKQKADKISTFSYFTNSVRGARDKRIIAPVAEARAKEPTQAERDAMKALNVKWHKLKGITTTRVGLQDFDWLKRYENEHGEVVLP